MQPVQKVSLEPCIHGLSSLLYILEYLSKASKNWFINMTKPDHDHYLYRRVSHYVLGTLYHSEVRETQLVSCLDQTHAVSPHFQQDLLYAYWCWIFPLRHLRTHIAVLEDVRGGGIFLPSSK